MSSEFSLAAASGRTWLSRFGKYSKHVACNGNGPIGEASRAATNSDIPSLTDEHANCASARDRVGEGENPRHCEE
jgi:hypothetical protein